MNTKEYEIMAEHFGAPCDYAHSDGTELTEKMEKWCELFCGIVSDADCWRKWFKEEQK